MASQPPRGKPPKRFRAAAAALRGDAPPPPPTASSERALRRGPPPPEPVAAAAAAAGAAARRGPGPRRVEVVLPDDRATGILFERDAASGRPVVLGFAASCRAAVVDALRPGMVLAKIAGVRCKAIDYARSLELVRALEKPLTLEFEAPKRRRSPSPSSSSSGSRRRRRRKEKTRRRRGHDERSPG
ncbi:hypothetical protein JL722_14935 [Aureococcus anophagefferens]|nr:hypothetical protein JL722_14935 [Aureococcus anophagefferens]